MRQLILTPGLITKRFLSVAADGTIAYDHFLSLAAIHPLESPLIRKVMYFLWAYRDERIRRFICERIASSSGTWRVAQLLNKTNATFFEQWLQESTARKARSNFEYFLVETKIFDPTSREVHLELDDGWLDQAAIAAAQHEKDPLLREELLASPAAFLKKRGWLGLLNVTEAELPKTSPLLSTDSVPLEDNEIAVDPTSTPIGKEWDRSSPATSGKKTTVANIDLVARERANKSHYAIEKLLAELAKENGLTAKFNQNIDMYFDTPNGTVLAEIKSCTDSNFHSQFRKGMSQLFEYRFLYDKLFSSEPALLLLMETAPPRKKKWLVSYAASLGIVLAWKGLSNDKIVSSCALPEALGNIITPIK